MLYQEYSEICPDTICIKNLEIFAYHGVLEQERQLGQHFFVNAELFLSAEDAGYEDILACSVDYSQVCQLIQETMTAQTYQLIEAAAQAVASAILRTYSSVRQVIIEIRKPEAPIAMPFQSVSVKIRRGWHTAVIALGSNIGDSRAYLQTAVETLQADENIRNLKQSAWCVTRPYGYTQQADFLNGAVAFETIYSPFRLLHRMQTAEQAAGRTREIHWGPRTLDLDLIFYDDVVIHTPELTVPHPDMQNREFVLEPVAQILPYYQHPVLKCTVRELLAALQDKMKS